MLLPGHTKVTLPFCEHCVISKQHRLKFGTSTSKSKCILDLIHSDVWQAPVVFLGVARYFVSFLYDLFRRCWVYPIRRKTYVLVVFKTFKVGVELESKKKIKCLRIDNGEEYTIDEFDNFCQHEDIKRQFTIAYTPQQKRVALRMNKTLLERKRAMLKVTGLGKPFWQKQSTSSASKLNYSRLHIFGSPVYVIYNTQEASKLDSKSRKCVFLGYADGVKGYRLWDPTAHKLVINRDVIFIEIKFKWRK